MLRQRRRCRRTRSSGCGGRRNSTSASSTPLPGSAAPTRLFRGKSRRLSQNSAPDIERSRATVSAVQLKSACLHSAGFASLSIDLTTVVLVCNLITAVAATEATPKSVLRLMAMKGLTLYHLKSHLQKYRMGKQSKKTTDLPNNGWFTGRDMNFSTGAPPVVPAGSDRAREMPLEDTLSYQIQVQRELCEQLEVQKKLQMRIEAQGRYLKEILEKAQKNISFESNGSAVLENTRSQLMDFNIALPGLMDNGTHVYEENGEHMMKAISDDNLNDNSLDFQLYHVQSQEAKNVRCAPKTKDLLLLDLNIKGEYDLYSRGMQRCESDTKINRQRK